MPLVHDDEWIGDLQLYRHEIRPFDEKLAPMLAAFADQAAIAVVNSKLLNDLQESNREVTAALEQQTAFADMLQVISTSTMDIASVLEKVVATAARLAGAEIAGIWNPLPTFRAHRVPRACRRGHCRVRPCVPGRRAQRLGARREGRCGAAQRLGLGELARRVGPQRGPGRSAHGNPGVVGGPATAAR